MRDTFHYITIKIAMMVIVSELHFYVVEREFHWIYAVIFH